MRPIYLTLAVLLISTSVLAMNAPKPKPGVVTKKKMYDAALVLLDTMNKDGIMQKQLGIAIDEQLKGMSEIPCSDRIMPQMRDIMNNAINYGALRNDLANVYANNFTLEELNWMVDFYKTPLGIKMQQTQPLIYETITNLSTARMKAAEPKIAALFASNLSDQKCQQRR